MFLRACGSALLLVFCAILAGCGPQTAQQSPVVVMISVDGMKPEYVTHADEHGAKVPNLRRFLKEGTYADGVQGVVPTVTYPSHTTLITGVWPAKHGIYNNEIFDPLGKNHSAWFWYTQDIKVPTLWDIFTEAGRKTASVQWPVSVGATHITWNIPEFWRAGTPEDMKLLRAVSTPGLIDEAKQAIGEDLLGGINSTPESDVSRGKYAAWILEAKHPALLTLHLLALDHIEHETGPFSPESIATIEKLDSVIGRVRESCEKVAPGQCVFAVVSDHGFVAVDKMFNVLPAFVKAGLITLDKDKKKVVDWTAMPWQTGGSFAVVLKDANDEATLKKVKELLDKYVKDPEAGIDRIWDAKELHDRGGFLPASFFVGLKPGWHTGMDFDKPVTGPYKPGGTHGAMNDLPELRSSFFLVGPNVPAGKDLGVIDMRSIAPTLAHRAGLELPSADGKNLLQ
jgi:predicted AlkP superfamily pyrophosphatase or phosphodiesterase